MVRVVVVTVILLILRVASRHNSHDVVNNSDNDTTANDDVDVPWLVSILMFLLMDMDDSDSRWLLLLSPVPSSLW